MRQTERQGEEMAKEIKFQCEGTYIEHAPDEYVFSAVSRIISGLREALPAFSVMVKHNDAEDRYILSFAWGGKNFCTIVCIEGEATVETDGFSTTFPNPSSCFSLSAKNIARVLEPRLQFLFSREKALLDRYHADSVGLHLYRLL